MSKKDLYQILGVNPNCTDDEIKAAYKKLAMRFHPDRYPAEAERLVAEARFKEVKDAKEILSHPDRRAAYDKFGYDEAKTMDASEAAYTHDGDEEPFNRDTAIFNAGILAEAFDRQAGSPADKAHYDDLVSRYKITPTEIRFAREEWTFLQKFPEYDLQTQEGFFGFVEDLVIYRIIPQKMTSNWEQDCADIRDNAAYSPEDRTERWQTLAREKSSQLSAAYRLTAKLLRYNQDLNTPHMEAALFMALLFCGKDDPSVQDLIRINGIVHQCLPDLGLPDTPQDDQYSPYRYSKRIGIAAARVLQLSPTILDSDYKVLYARFGIERETWRTEEEKHDPYMDVLTFLHHAKGYNHNNSINPDFFSVGYTYRDLTKHLGLLDVADLVHEAMSDRQCNSILVDWRICRTTIAQRLLADLSEVDLSTLTTALSDDTSKYSAAAISPLPDYPVHLRFSDHPWYSENRPMNLGYFSSAGIQIDGISVQPDDPRDPPRPKPDTELNHFLENRVFQSNTYKRLTAQAKELGLHMGIHFRIVREDNSLGSGILTTIPHTQHSFWHAEPLLVVTRDPIERFVCKSTITQDDISKARVIRMGELRCTERGPLVGISNFRALGLTSSQSGNDTPKGGGVPNSGTPASNGTTGTKDNGHWCPLAPLWNKFGIRVAKTDPRP